MPNPGLYVLVANYYQPENAAYGLDLNITTVPEGAEAVDVEEVLTRIQDRKLVKDDPTDQDIFKDEVASLIRRVRSSDGVRFQCVVCQKTLKMKAHVIT